MLATIFPVRRVCVREQLLLTFSGLKLASSLSFVKYLKAWEKENLGCKEPSILREIFIYAYTLWLWSMFTLPPKKNVCCTPWNFKKLKCDAWHQFYPISSHLVMWRTHDPFLRVLRNLLSYLSLLSLLCLLQLFSEQTFRSECFLVCEEIPFAESSFLSLFSFCQTSANSVCMYLLCSGMVCINCKFLILHLLDEISCM